MKRLIITLMIFACGCSSFGRPYKPISESGDNVTPNPDLGTVTLKERALDLGGDSIIVHRGELVFGFDPDIRIHEDNKAYPNPFCSPPPIRIFNLTSDTLTVATVENDAIPARTLYRGVAARGMIDIRIDLGYLYPSGVYMVEITVGEETKRAKLVHLK